MTIEEGNSDTYDVVLNTEPDGDVTVTIGGTTGTDLSLDKDTLTFTDQNWDQPQTVTVTADHDSDAVDEAQVTLTHTVSSPDDGAYDGLDADDVTVTVTDDDPQMEYSLVDAGPFDEDAGTVQVEVVAVTNEDGVPSIDYAVAVQSEDVTANFGRRLRGSGRDTRVRRGGLCGVHGWSWGDSIPSVGVLRRRHRRQLLR